MNQEQRMCEILPALGSDGAEAQGVDVRGLREEDSDQGRRFLVTSGAMRLAHASSLCASYLKCFASLAIKKKRDRVHGLEKKKVNKITLLS